MAQRKPEERTTLSQILTLVDQLSSDEQEELRVKLNTHWILRPQNQEMDQLRREAHQALTNAGVTVDELKEEVERIKEERLAERYPGLGQ